jgi:protein-S-isoprenylcysteine O-methyltransferase Ste14
LLERFNRSPLDGYWQVSLALRGKLREIDRRALGQHLLGWLVKAFFTPLMFIYASNAVSRLRTFDPRWVFTDFTSFYDFTYDTLFAVDVVLAVTGYLLTVRLLDSHIRSTEPTLLGWAAALACYQPFWSFVEGNYLSYGSGGSTWGTWFSGTPAIYVAWACAILALTAVYLWATIPFGIRFSNLTHRGILTNGPYRFTKHPAYVSKNLSWWLISMPFLSSGGWQTALRCSVMLLGLNCIYFLRARTEERHLSRDPDYVAYAEAMEQRGIFRWLGRLVPALRFRSGRLFDL